MPAHALDEFRHSLSDLGSVFGRLVFFSSLRDDDGRYRHPGLVADLGGEEADRVIRAAHEAAFAEWLTFGLDAQKSDLELYLEAFDGSRKRAVIHLWDRVEPHRGLVPKQATDQERELYLADFEAVLAVLAAQYSA